MYVQILDCVHCMACGFETLRDVLKECLHAQHNLPFPSIIYQCAIHVGVISDVIVLVMSLCACDLRYRARPGDWIWFTCVQCR